MNHDNFRSDLVATYLGLDMSCPQCTEHALLVYESFSRWRCKICNNIRVLELLKQEPKCVGESILF
jgi:transposase-like protein